MSDKVEGDAFGYIISEIDFGNCGVWIGPTTDCNRDDTRVKYCRYQQADREVEEFLKHAKMHKLLVYASLANDGVSHRFRVNDDI